MKFIGILIKPDVHERGIYTAIIKEFENLEYDILLEYDIFLSKKDIRFLYPDSYRTPVGKEALCNYLENKKSTIVLFALKKGDSIEEEIAKLQIIKGKKESRTGLRYKYNNILITDSEIKEKKGKYYQFMMKNIFHVFDNNIQLNYFLKKYEKTKVFSDYSYQK